VVVNGIDSGTLAHQDAKVKLCSGNLTGDVYPTMGATIVGILAPDYTMSQLSNGGKVEGAGLPAGADQIQFAQ